LKNAVQNGAIDKDAPFDEGMVDIVASEIKKIQLYGYTKFLERKRIREAVKKALKKVSIYK